MLLFQITLQDKCGGDGIVLSFLFSTGLPHQAPGGYGGQTLVPEVYGDSGITAQFLGKGLYLLRLFTQATIHGARQTDYNLFNLVLVNNLKDSLDIGIIIFTVNNSQRTGNYAPGVAERHPNPSIPDIKTKTTRSCLPPAPAFLPA